MFLKPFFSAPIDIMIMLLGAFLIGYVIAWLLRNMRINALQDETEKLQQEVRNVHIDNENLDIATDKLQDQLNQCVESKADLISIEEVQQATTELKKEQERSKTAWQSLSEIESAHEVLKQELQLKIDQMLTQEEANKLRAEVNRLRVFNTNLEEEIRELKGPNLAPRPPNEIAVEAPLNDVDSTLSPGQDFVSSIGIKSASADVKDDLKKISGVGPFIEEKLNRIGIYTFEQIASITTDQADKITEAIEFFPGRIQRDDWVGQARWLENKRMGE
jgi:predicted flap endonuclease-1-like 5' DNA nuclease